MGTHHGWPGLLDYTGRVTGSVSHMLPISIPHLQNKQLYRGISHRTGFRFLITGNLFSPLLALGGAASTYGPPSTLLLNNPKTLLVNVGDPGPLRPGGVGEG